MESVSHENRVVKNITITLPVHVARQARIWAAEADTSVSQFLGRMLTERMEWEAGYERAQRNFLSRGQAKLRENEQSYPRREELHERAGIC